MTNRKALEPASTPVDGLVDALVTTAMVTTAVINRLGAELDLSLSQVRLLGILWDRRARMSELADYLGLEKQTLSGLVARAETRGLLEREPNAEDGRVTDVFLTKRGRALVTQLRARGQQSLAPLVARLSVAEQRQLQSLLERVLDSRHD